MTPASRFKRFLAYCIDTLILAIPSYFIGKWVASQTPTIYKTAAILSPLIPLIYYVLLESSKYQASLGKQLFNLYVSDLHNHTLTLPRALGRYLLLLIPHILLLYVQITSASEADFVAKISDHPLMMWVYFVIVLVWIIPIFFTQARTTFYDMLSSTRVNRRLES